MTYLSDPHVTVVPVPASSATPLIPVEDPGIDPNPMIHLFARLEEAAAEREICDILDAINSEIAQIRMTEGMEALRDITASIERLCRRSGRFGLHGLSRVAADMLVCLQANDMPALHATRARLLRMADRSMSEIWNGAHVP